MFEMLNITPTTLVTFGLAITVGILILKSGRKKYKLPPYPWIRIPIIGNIISLMRLKEKAFIEFYKTSKKPQYNKVFMIQVGARDVCILNHIDVVREALVNKAVAFANRPDIFSMDHIYQNRGVMFGRYGKVWKFNRKVAHQAMRNFALGEVLENIVQSATKTTIAAIEKEGNKPFVLKPYIELLVFNLVVGISFGKTYDFDNPEFKSFTNFTKDFMENLGQGLPADVFPWMKFIPFQGRKLWAITEVFMKLLEREVKEHKETFDPDNLRDMADYLILNQRQAEEEEQDMKGVLTDTDLIYTIFDIFNASLDTINASIQSSIATTIMFPEQQEKLQKEIEDVLGGRLPSNVNRKNMPQMEAFLCESLRYNTFSVLGLPLSTTTDTTIGGYELPKDMMVMVNFWALHHDEDYWEAPDEFRPERFLDEAGNLAKRPASFMPFSAGKRVCVGEAVAKAELLMVLPMLLQKFKFLPAPDFKYGVEDSGLLNIPKPYSVIVESRY